MNRLTIFRVIAWFAGIYHIALGILGTFAPIETIDPLVEAVYGVEVTIDSQFVYMVKFISAYFIAFGTMMALLGSNPKKYRALVLPAILLFGIRILERLFYFDLLSETFNVTMLRNMQTVIPITLMFMGLLLFRPRNSK